MQEKIEIQRKEKEEHELKSLRKVPQISQKSNEIVYKKNSGNKDLMLSPYSLEISPKESKSPIQYQFV